MALAIASGVTPAQGLYTAIVAGFFIALLGGSRYQIGGPTGAFVVVIFNVMQNYGYDGLAATMLIAGSVLIISGYLRLGSYIKYIPYPVVVGFTAGIGLSLISTQVKDLLGLKIENVPAEFLPKWESYLANLNSFSAASLVISLLSLSAILYMQIKNRSCRPISSASPAPRCWSPFSALTLTPSATNSAACRIFCRCRKCPTFRSICCSKCCRAA